jgi:hypothetical protein
MDMRPLTRPSGQVANDEYFNKVCPVIRSSTTRMTHNRVSVFSHRKQKCKSVLSQVRHWNANAATHLQQTFDVLTANVPRICIGLMEKRLFQRGGMSANWGVGGNSVTVGAQLCKVLSLLPSAPANPSQSRHAC